MPHEKIGKYEVLERVGRGGMGMIYKAHDPVLNRAVALKVISTEIDVTDELRTRFFREAQACGRLSHPNIVTVYDMGEDNGQLFIVMEFLEGEELRRVIAQRRALALEDKLSIMMQICDGLYYAHQMGIVHRDIKPGNVMLLRNGQVKLLDFGIAQIAAATEGGLTRTGLIMGTLRYISPEQVRGRADHRSDMFSLGAVFYELLSLRPPFTSEDPMQILEQLRTEEPPSLIGLDPTIPPELAAIVERAMRKDPAERFPDVGKMRAELEVVQRGLAEDVRQVRGRVRRQLDQIREIQAALAERLGALRDEETAPTIDERVRLPAMQTIENDLASRIGALQARIAQADSLAPAFRRGTELLEAGLFADAALEFEAIVADMPEHARALDGLEEARARADAQRRQQLAAKVVQDARAALDDGGYDLCLEILKQAAEIPPPAEAADEIASLRQTAEAALAAQEAARRERQTAEQARERMAQARRTAQAQAAAQHARDLWHDAERRSTEAQAAFAREAYADAGQAFDAAAVAYREAEGAGRAAQLREREAAERAREQAAQVRQSAQAAGAPQYARELWDAAEAKSVQAEAAFGKKALGDAISAFGEAVALYRRAQEAGAEARQRAEEARDRAAQAQRSAAAADAERHAPPLWNEASARSAQAQAALAREQYGKAAEAFDGAVALYREAETQARDARRRQRDQAEQARQAVAERRRSALAADAASHAPSDWNEAEASAASGEAAFEREAYTAAGGSFVQGATLYGRAEERAREAIRALEIARADAETGREAAGRARQVAAEAQASKYAVEEWRAGESTESQASAALSRQEYAAARSLFAEVRRQYAAAARAASVAAEAEARRADAMMGDARRLLEAGDVAACLRRLDGVVALRPGHPAVEALRQKAEEALRQAEAAPRKAEAAAQEVAAQEAADVADDSEVDRTTLVTPTVRAKPPTELVEAPSVPTAPSTPPVGFPPVPAVGPARGVADVTRVVTPPPTPSAGATREATDVTRVKAPPTPPATPAREVADITRVVTPPPTPSAGATREATDVTRVKAPPTPPAGPARDVADVTRVVTPPPTSPAGVTREATDITRVKSPPPTAPTGPASDADDVTRVMTRPPTPPAGPARDVDDATRVMPRRDATVLPDEDATRVSPAPRGVIDTGPTRRRTPAAELPGTSTGWLPRLGAQAAVIALGALAVFVLAAIALVTYSSLSRPAPPVPVPAPQTTPAPKSAPPPAVKPAEPPARRGEEPGKQEPAARAEAPKAEAAKADTAKAETARVEAAKAEAAKAEGTRAAALAGKQAAARAAGSQAAEARRAAELAEAPKLAAALWAKAGAAQHKADNALKQNEFDRAPALFGDAAKAYQEAEKSAASQSAAAAAATARQRALEEEQARVAATRARDTEQAAVAERQRGAALQRQQSEAEQARERVTNARHAAEQAGAGQHAPKLVASAQTKERDGIAALGRSDWGVATQRLGDAQADYQAAAQEAHREKELEQRQVALLKSNADELRRRTLARRDQAIKAEADRLAKDLFATAEAKLTEADGLAGRQSFIAANQAYPDAADRYLEATARAQTVREARAQADTAKARMVAEKQRANQATPEFGAAIAEERQANSLYERLAYKDAAEKFRSAETLFTRAVARSAPPPPEPKPAEPRPAEKQQPRRQLPPSF